MRASTAAAVSTTLITVNVVENLHVISSSSQDHSDVTVTLYTFETDADVPGPL
jgi:hypothetical protein